MKMQEYEFYLMLSGRLDDAAVSRVIKDIEALLIKHGGKITSKDIKGRQKLAYQIGDYNDANQVLLGVSLDTAAVSELRVQINLMEDVVRAGIYNLSRV